MDGIGKADAIVRAVAKGLVGRVSAAAKADSGPTRQTKGCTGRVHDLEITFNPDRTVTINRNLRRCHDLPFLLLYRDAWF